MLDLSRQFPHLLFFFLYELRLVLLAIIHHKSNVRFDEWSNALIGLRQQGRRLSRVLSIMKLFLVYSQPDVAGSGAL